MSEPTTIRRAWSEPTTTTVYEVWREPREDAWEGPLPAPELVGTSDDRATARRWQDLLNADPGPRDDPRTDRLLRRTHELFVHVLVEAVTERTVIT